MCSAHTNRKQSASLKQQWEEVMQARHKADEKKTNTKEAALCYLIVITGVHKNVSLRVLPVMVMSAIITFYHLSQPCCDDRSDRTALGPPCYVTYELAHTVSGTSLLSLLLLINWRATGCCTWLHSACKTLQGQLTPCPRTWGLLSERAREIERGRKTLHSGYNSLPAPNK